MSRHLVDPELVIGLDGPMPQSLSDATLPGYRATLEALVAAIPKPISPAMQAVRLDVRRGADEVPVT